MTPSLLSSSLLSTRHPPNGNANVHYAMYASPLKNAECIFFWCVWGAHGAAGTHQVTKGLTLN